MYIYTYVSSLVRFDLKSLCLNVSDSSSEKLRAARRCVWRPPLCSLWSASCDVTRGRTCCLPGQDWGRGELASAALGGDRRQGSPSLLAKVAFRPSACLGDQGAQPRVPPGSVRPRLPCTAPPPRELVTANTRVCTCTRVDTDRHRARLCTWPQSLLSGQARVCSTHVHAHPQMAVHTLYLPAALLMHTCALMFLSQAGTHVRPCLHRLVWLCVW